MGYVNTLYFCSRGYDMAGFSACQGVIAPIFGQSRCVRPA